MSNQSIQDIAFSASGLTRYFGNKPIVKQCSFAIPRGTVTGLLGLNGTGKTTTIRMLMGFLPPTRGSSAILGGDICLDLGAMTRFFPKLLRSLLPYKVNHHARIAS